MNVLLPALLAGFLALASSPVRAADQAGSDETFKTKISGSWSEGVSPYSVATFKTGGVYEARMYRDESLKQLVLTAHGTWWIKDGRLYNEVHTVDPPKVPTGKVYVDEIVEITATKMTLIDERGKRYEKKRVR